MPACVYHSVDIKTEYVITYINGGDYVQAIKIYLTTSMHHLLLWQNESAHPWTPHPYAIAPLLACHLIVLGNCPGVHPIAIVDTAHRIISKAVLSIMSPYIKEVTGSQQLCGGQISGVEAAIHAMI